jgi:group I intron endonuclease
MNNFQLYYLCHPDTNEVRYVGITKNGLKKRLSQHLNKPSNENLELWFNELKEDGKKPVIKEIKKCISYEDLLNSEYEEIKKLKDNNFNLLNVLDGGLVNPMLGRTHSDRVKKIISEKNSGRKVSEITKEKIKNSLIIKWSNNPLLREKHSKLNSGEKNPFYGKTHSIETIEKLKQIAITNGGYQGKKNPNHKYDISEKTLYELFVTQNKTISEISKLFNCSINTINKNLRNYNIVKPLSNIYGLNKKEIRNYLINGLNYVQIGEKYGCGNKIIHKYVKKHNLYVK